MNFYFIGWEFESLQGRHFHRRSKMENAKVDLLQQAVVNMINSSVASIDKGVTWLSGQLPDVIQQYLTWKLYYNALYGSLFLGFMLLFLVIIPIIAKKNYDKRFKDYTNNKIDWYRRPDPDAYCAMAAASIFLGGVLIFPTISYISEVIQILVAPKVYLIEWAANLVRPLAK